MISSPTAEKFRSKPRNEVSHIVLFTHFHSPYESFLLHKMRGYSSGSSDRQTVSGTSVSGRLIRLPILWSNLGRDLLTSYERAKTDSIIRCLLSSPNTLVGLAGPKVSTKVKRTATHAEYR